MQDRLDDGQALERVRPAEAEPEAAEPLFDLGGDERRMHVRAYNHWVSLLKGRPCPLIEDLDAASIDDFGAHGVLLDFAGDVTDPGIRFLGRTLADECGLASGISRVAEVPPRSLLSRLTDHYLQIIANKAPIGFEAEFVSSRGRTTLYRGILMPFTSVAGGEIDFVYGVINWKEVADAAVQARIDSELDAALRVQARADVPAWADGPGAENGAEGEQPLAPPGSLADTLLLARETAAAVRAADTRSRAALYRALGRAHDFGLAAVADDAAYTALLAEAGIAVQARAPLTPVVKLVFGADYDKTRLTEFASVLGHARRHGIAAGRLPTFLDGFAGGIKAVVAAERAARKPAPAAERHATLADRPAIARLSLQIDAAAGTGVVLVARMGDDGVLDIVEVRADEALASRALRTGKRPKATLHRG
ncbi:hypothetical protein [Sphingomonas rubra]|uniref:Uncharacterized protein n=1 Tax=Sphingomonas rubra TaxID=634430 RepID=A0A1I5TY85_9SPHN|nr:hypothetical protein [Sphingomonas rubra]SFP88008.1 hypothetical protein SAMN04488241_109174 [Sphingomonas rubra]